MLKQRQDKVRNKCVCQLIQVDKRKGGGVWLNFYKLGDDLKTEQKRERNVYKLPADKFSFCVFTSLSADGYLYLDDSKLTRLI